MSAFTSQSEDKVSKKQLQNKGLKKHKKFQKQNFANMIEDEFEMLADIQDEAWEAEFNDEDYF